MIILPVFQRELRAESRRPFNYWLRVIGAAAAVLVCAFQIVDTNVPPAKLGAKLFAILHATIFVTIWVLVPALTSDCLSREKREGTLGLLFLTPLTARSIVLGKSLVHALRSMTLWLSAVPILAIPLLLGGVGWLDVVTAFTLEMCALILALAAGLLASSFAKRWARALMLAEISSVCFAVMFALLIFVLFMLNAVVSRPTNSRSGGFRLSFNQLAEPLIVLSTGVDPTLQQQTLLWSQLFNGTNGRTTTTWLEILAQIYLLSVLAFVFIVSLAIWRVNRSWREEPPSARMLWWERVFCTPIIYVKYFRRMMRHKLEKNPIGWLEQRTWSGRLVTWSWFAVMISLYSLSMSDSNLYLGSFDALQNLMAWLLAGSMAFTAAGSFRRERETGVLELLLVSPVSVGQIIGGRLRGLWGQFLPAIVVLLGIWIYFANLLNAQIKSDAWGAIGFGGMFLALPVIGLYYSLRCGNFISAFLRTVLVGLLAPVLLARAFAWLFYWAFNVMPAFWPGDRYQLPLIIGCVQVMFALHFWKLLDRNLTRRTFALEGAIK